jgi:hypothetical protein
MPINNNFAIPTSPDPSVDYYWPGILLQLGHFPPDPLGRIPQDCEQIVFSKNGNPVGDPLLRSNYSSKVLWVNVVSRPAENKIDPPMVKELATLLDGSPYPSTHPCNPPAVDPSCLRAKKLHAQMERVFGMVTYWHGPKGYELKTIQDNVAKPGRFEFSLLDDFRVEVYEIDPNGLVTSIGSHAYGDIDLVEIKTGSMGGPSDGDKQDPPWPK